MTTTIEVGMLGLGTVGSGVVERLTQAARKIEQTQGIRLHLAAVAVNHLNAPRAVKLPIGTRLTDSLTNVVCDQRIQLIIEVMGTVATAKSAIKAALNQGKSVVTANKDLIATAGAELTALARRQHCDLFYEASVAGGIPILRTLTDSYATDNIQSVDGIINGTANYILSAMTAGQTYGDALAAAQAAGYAEADPTNDVGGIDAAYKLMILSRFAFGQGLTFQQVAPVGITGLSATICQTVAQHRWQIKLLAQATQHNQQLYCRVAPVAVAQTQPLSEIAGVQNAIAVQSDAIGASLYTGPGAGSTATANSVLNDVIVAAQHLVNGQSAVNTALPVNQGAVTNLADLPQDYLVVGAKAVSAVQVYANEVDFSLQTLAPDCLRLNALTARQRQQVARQVQVTLVPIAGTVRWPAATKNAITTPVHVAI
ncbi:MULTISPECIES: homoserine dehydrogenase [Lactiplantibacillus]|uniref:homoserine dehydrogenase n=1 Tax=Lactiplantibacillus TaxID=2767842 RepID=UPI001C1F8F60|nr:MULTISPECIES: homoserine dehydrogenase [Lactiplantibacillus]MBU7449351.1 homoserine dehydrogenase [Lactiplantibacillus sp. 7.2.4]MBU7481738.1 homoserine dehydrogenase [Lactiplantibacillus pentosus]MBU7503984.1 homoserine dehydrogenase [Lactiplantibacillus pentosus]MDY1545695.1 homoserine dehydrogenase [Lactiplantibacillus pentosus]